MTETPTLDDFERAIAHTLHTKADQLDVDDEASFDPEPATSVPLRLVGEPVHPARARRRILAVAAAVAVLAGAAAIRTLGANDGEAPPLATGDVTWNEPPEQGTAAFAPTRLPDGWVLSGVNVSQHGDVPTTWQLFAVDGPSPLERGVIVGSAPGTSRSLPGGPTHTVQGRPAVMSPSNHPNVPADALEIDWDGGEAFHDVVAVGLTEAELLDFLDSLVPRADPGTGFDLPADAPLAEQAAVTTDDVVVSSLRYASPDGTSEIRVSAVSADFGGGLLHRLTGEERLGGHAIDGTQGTWRFVSVARPDGWTVDVGTRSTSLDPAGLDAVVESVQPVTEQQLVDLATAEPVAATHTIDGWTVDVHGREHAPVGVCLTPPTEDAVVCGLASAHPSGGSALTTGSVLVDGRWIVVVLTDGSQRVEVQTTPSRFAGSEDDYDQRTLWEDPGSGEAATALVPVPADVDAVMVGIVTDTPGMSGFAFERPTG